MKFFLAGAFRVGVSNRAVLYEWDWSNDNSPNKREYTFTKYRTYRTSYADESHMAVFFGVVTIPPTFAPDYSGPRRRAMYATELEKMQFNSSSIRILRANNKYKDFVSRLGRPLDA